MKYCIIDDVEITHVCGVVFKDALRAYFEIVKCFS